METAENVESFFYVKLALRTLKRHWYVFAFSVFVFLGLALFVNWYLQSVYEVSSIILVNEPVKNTPDPSEEFMKPFSIFQSTSDIQQEIMKMKSWDLVYKALKKMNSEITYYTAKGKGLKMRELYHDAPFSIELFKGHLQPMNVKFQLSPVSETQFKLSVEKNEGGIQLFNYEKNISSPYAESLSLDNVFNYGDTLQSKWFCFKIVADKERMAGYPSDASFYFSFNNLIELTYAYQKEISIEQVSKDVQAASIKIKVTNAQKGIDFINELTNAYLQRNLDKKNSIAENTIHYIDAQLGIMEDSLKLTEGTLQSFKSSNQIMEINSKADEAFKAARDLENQKSEIQAKINYYTFINNNIERNGNGMDLIVPSSMGINDNVLSGIIEEYIKLYSERNSLMQNKQNQSPYFASLTIKMNNVKNILSQNVKQLIKTNTLQLNSVGEQLSKQNARITALPNTQRKLVGIERKYQLDDNIYSYLMKKKAEAQVAKASNIPDTDILEPAKLTQMTPVSPNKTVNIAIALALGFLLPFIGFGIKSFTDDAVANAQMVQSITALPSLGQVYHKKGRQKSVFTDAPNSAIAESVRTVRTNLEYVLQGRRQQVILITSAGSGEGKSFTAMNLAVSLSLLNRKTILVDFDLRKPNLYDSLPVGNKAGVSTFLNNDPDVEDMIAHASTQHLDVIAAGPVPSNPAELISSERAERLIRHLKEKYDYVIIETPPVGLVADAYPLMKYADMKIFVVRENFTNQKQLAALLQEVENKNIPNVYWLLNDVDISGTHQGRNNQYYAGK